MCFYETTLPLVFLRVPEYSVTWLQYSLFPNHSRIDERGGCFRYFATSNRTAVNIPVRPSVCLGAHIFCRMASGGANSFWRTHSHLIFDWTFIAKCPPKSGNFYPLECIMITNALISYVKSFCWLLESFQIHILYHSVPSVFRAAVQWSAKRRWQRSCWELDLERRSSSHHLQSLVLNPSFCF